MVKQKFDNLEKKVEKKYLKREKKKKPRMKVSGASVKSLNKIIKQK